MKYFVLIPDGMADTPVPSLGNRTPMEAAHKPSMDALAAKSLCGRVLNVPDGMVPESDTANLAILSYDPRTYSKGRSPLEAMSQGLEMSPADTALRCNFVTLSGDAETDVYEDRVILDHSSDEITTAEADELVKALNEALPMPGRVLHTGVSYRHCLLWENACETYDFMRPHDILGKVIGDYLPKADNGGAEFLAYMKEGAKVLEHHPVNEARRARGLRPANSPWLWSPGKKPALPSFPEKWGVRAAIISAVDLIKGIGICANCDVIDVEGATGNFATNYTGKANAAIDAFKNGCDLVYVHVEAPDECGHRGEADVKVAAIEKIDSLILAPVLDYLETSGEDFRILVLPDHPTPIATRTHSSEPVPFFLYDSGKTETGVDVYTEASCAAKELYIPDGSTLLSHMIEK
ncbi:MAG: cofactor-independent phosphoglycerate mutase [Ruminococcaceae bacterium]|nr:cofactor-independent phosphoglycerate mutase [Oscillospiraceae bacterium]